ncbi:MAG TPA: inositol monophosphatase family protein [Solirubrobacteraceae bacterium]|nr:inositol monophosphatase family protein [Solirubrobacteraceae bacterium]
MSAAEDELLAVAHEAARASAGELMARFGHRQRDIRSKSGPTDLVSEADVSAEAAIRRVLAQRRPDDAILGEEGGETGDGDLRWVIDPLDGTINFLFEIPLFAVSVACEDRDGTVVGVVLDPVRDELFAATRSGPPTLNRVEIAGSGRDDLSRALVATGFSYDAGVRAKQAVAVSRVLPRVRDIRRGGAAALDLVWCACGRYDAYYERGVKAWDIAAGSLIAQRAGLAVRDLPDGEDGPHGLLAAPPAVVDELLGLVLGS